MEDFVRPGSIGEQLQERLEVRRGQHKNWIYEWWNEAAYLAFREPVVPFVSYFYSHRDDRRRRDPAKRAAALTTAVLDFKTQLDNGTLEPEYMKRLPVSMESYQWMFNACRIPAKPSDHPIKYPAAENEHIVVVRKNQFFKVPHSVNGQQLNTTELEHQFRHVYKSARKAPAIGLLTTENRDVWTEARTHLFEAHPNNATTLRTIESASFLVCLDDASPVTLEERAHQYWHGDGANRWFDKPLQFIVNDNGTSGFTGEHSMMDGTPTQRLNDYANMLILTNKLDFSNPSRRSEIPDPTPLFFHTNEAIKADIRKADADFEAVMAQHELKVQAYQGYGKGLIKKFRCSPDAYVQMIIQLAYHKFHGLNRPTYESATTRRFQQGRTEACRSVSDESVAFCDAMADPEIPRDECEKRFRTALDVHVKYINDALDGKGVDRHLFGLKKCLKEGEVLPALFKDKAYVYSGTWYVSTSQLSSEYFNGYGWSQVVDQGWGIAYMVNEDRCVLSLLLDYLPSFELSLLLEARSGEQEVARRRACILTCVDSIQFNVVSKGLGCERMSFYLNEAAGDIRDMLLPSLEKPKAKL